MKRVRVEEWLLRNSSYLNYQAIEADAKISTGVLQEFILGQRSMSDDTIQALERLIQYRFLDSIPHAEIL